MASMERCRWLPTSRCRRKNRYTSSGGGGGCKQRLWRDCSGLWSGGWSGVEACLLRGLAAEFKQ